MFERNSFWKRFLSAHVAEGMSPHERNVIYATQGASLFLALLGPVFLVLNFTQNNLPLALVNCVSTTLGLVCLFLVRHKFVHSAATLLVAGGCVVFFFSGLIFHNGMEYTLLVGMLGAVFMFEALWARILLAGANGAGFLAVKALHFTPGLPGQLSIERYAVNLLIFLISYYLILEIFRTVHCNYQRTIEQKNADLAESQRRLDAEHAKLTARTSELQAANQAKEKLFSVLAHDLRGPVGNLKISMDLLSNRQLSLAEFQSMAAELKSGVDHAYECLDSLLVWSAGQLQAAKSVFTNVPLEAVARGCATLLAASASRKSIAMNLTVPTTAHVWADEIQVASLFRNLLSNALKFTPPHGSITVSAAEEERFWRVTIRDTGVGMPADKVRRLLETHEVGSTEGTENERGFGLGLQICQDVIRNHGGTFSVESQEGLGSAFHFTLPKPDFHGENEEPAPANPEKSPSP